MSGFDQLHPALRHHIVNSLGWRDLRPFQEAVIEPILGGEHLVVLAPTAGGKTEAAFFPVVSRMLSENWTGLSLLYLCPIKALLNNLETRLDRYSTLLGRRSALWHGDVPASKRRQILREPPDCLLTTPESLEVMLVSPRVESRRLFGNLQAVIIDSVPSGGRRLEITGLGSTRRTFERRVRLWRSTRAPGKAVMFPQVHHPGQIAASDFTVMTAFVSGFLTVRKIRDSGSTDT